jgi:hypothetical protein
MRAYYLRLHPKLRLLVYSLVMYAALALPLGLAHEAGHHWICLSAGYSSHIWFGIDGGHQTCGGSPDNTIMYYASGGMMGLAVSLMVAVSALYSLKYTAPLLIAALTYGVDNFAKIFLEGFMTNVYLSDLGGIVLAPFQIGILFALWFNIDKFKLVQKTLQINEPGR